MVDKKKPTKKRQASLGKALQDKIARDSKDITGASDAFTKEALALSKSIDLAIETEDKNIKALLEKIDNLNKDNVNYEKHKKGLQFEIAMSEAKTKAFNSLGDSLSVISKLTEKLLEDLEKGDGNTELVADQVSHLASVALQLEALGAKTKFDRDEVIEKFSKILNEKQLAKIEKKLKKLDDYLFDPMKRAGLISTITDYLGANILGPLGKPVVEALKLSEKIENKVEKAVSSVLGLEKEIEKSKNVYEEIKKRVEESQLKDEEKEKLLNALSDQEERHKEQEADRTQDFRATTIALQKKGLDKSEEASLGVMQILTMLTGGKLIAGIAKGLIAALSAKGLLNLLKGRFAAGLGSAATSAAAAKTFMKANAGTIGKTVLKRAGVIGAGFTSWEIGQDIGRKINEEFGDEISDAVWWALEEAPDDVKERFLKAKEAMASTILNSATSVYNAHLSMHQQSFQYLNNLKNSLLDKTETTNKNNATAFTYNMIANEITRLKNNNENLNKPFYMVPKSERILLKDVMPVTPAAKEKETKEKESTPPPMQMPGKISMDEIPMLTNDDALLLLTTSNLK